jgi:hypothetical protein
MTSPRRKEGSVNPPRTPAAPRTRTKIALLLVAGGVGVAALQGCGTAAHKPQPPAPAAQPSNPLDNNGTAGSLLAVKVDNVGSHTQSIQKGLSQADIVYWIQVEGGLSRFLAVYDSNHLPDQVGPVRSARQTDIPLLQQYGRVDFAYSGAISGLIPMLNQADVQNVTPFTDPGAFSNRAEDPTFIDPHQVLAKYPSVSARSPGYVFGPAPSGGTELTDGTWHQPAASLGVHYNGSGYDVSTDGHPSWSGTATVVVQHVSIVPGLFTDHNAGHADNEVFSETTGSGQAEVLRDGKVWNTHWSRPDAASGTSFTLPDGSAMPFATGPVLVVMVP